MLLACLVFILILFLTTAADGEATEVFATVGSPAVLPCKSSSTAPIDIVWTKVNQGTVWRKQKSGLQLWGSGWSKKGVHRAKCPHPQFARGNYSLQISNVQREDGGVYTCSEGQIAETVVTLRIITVSASMSSSQLSVTCDVTPWPRGASFQWRLNNSPYSPHTRSATPHIVMEKAALSLTGTWTCVVSYNGKVGQASAKLPLKGIILPVRNNTRVYAAVGSSVTLPCVFSIQTLPSSFLWEKLQPSSLFKKASSQSAFSSTSFKLPWDRSATLKEADFNDKGTYRCSGKLYGQRLARTVQLVVAKVDSFRSTSSGNVTLTCTLSDASEVTGYEWVQVINDANGTQSLGPVHQGKSLIISQGTWTCRFFSKEGVLGNVTYNLQMMSAMSDNQESTGPSQNTAVVVGLSFLLLVLLVILAQMYKNHQRRKRILQFLALETITHTAVNERERRERSQEKQ